MIPYYVTFILSCIFCYMGEKIVRSHEAENNIEYEEYQNKKRNWRVISFPTSGFLTVKSYNIYFFFAVLMVAILAGIRGYTVGTDVQVYGNDLFYYARTVSWSQFYHSLTKIEPLYLLLVYFSSRFSSEPHIQYFFIGLIIYTFVMAGIVKNKRNISITFAWFAFLCLLYGDTYNAMRQCLAISVAFFAFDDAKNQRYFRYILKMIIAFLFHNSAILAFAIFAIYFILQKNNKMWVKVFLIVATVGGISCFNEILTFFIGTGLLNEKMNRYLIGESTGLSIPAILIRLPFLILIILQKKQFFSVEKRDAYVFPLKNEAEADFYILCLIIELISVELSAFLPSLYRISLFFVPFRCIAYARLIITQKKYSIVLYGMVMIAYLLLIFIYQNQIKGNNEIYPYVFGIF